jgi:hypothetical protein
MKRIIFSLALAALAASSPLFAQTQFDFRSTSSGIWTDSKIWEKNEAGIWLKPVDGIYPGERHNRDVDVTVDDGSTVTIGKDQVVHINSLSVLGGRVVVEGMLIIGPTSDDPNEIGTDPNQNANDPIAAPIIISDNLAPQLLQNVPNPLAPQFGYETTIKFFLDKQYTNARLAIYDQLGHVVLNVYQESNPSEGWHTVKARLDRIQTGSYPLVLELPNSILRRMIMVIR